MALTITKSTQAINVSNLTVCVYGQPGIGKTSIAFTAEKPLLIDFDNGAYRSANRKDVVQVSSWNDIASMTDSDIKDYNTIILDTVGRALDVLQKDIILRNPKAGNKSGGLTLQGFGALKTEFISWLKMISTMGKDIILIAHMDEQRQGDDIIERLDITGGSKNEIYKVSDAMGRLKFEGGKRVLDFNPSGSGFGKNPAQLDSLQIPNYALEPNFLAEVIASIKNGLNQQTEEAKVFIKEVEDQLVEFNSIELVDGFNNKLIELKDAKVEIKKALIKAANDKGFIFDSKAKQFLSQQPKEAVA